MWIDLHIQYIFFYLFKLTWIETHGTDHLFLFTYENQLLWDMAFFLIFIIYLFSYWKWCQQKHVELLQMNPLYNLRYFYNVLIKWNLLLKIYSYTTVMVMCPKEEQNANWSQVEIENLIVRAKNIPSTISTKSGAHIYFFKRK